MSYSCSLNVYKSRRRVETQMIPSLQTTMYLQTNFIIHLYTNRTIMWELPWQDNHGKSNQHSCDQTAVRINTSRSCERGQLYVIGKTAMSGQPGLSSLDSTCEHTAVSRQHLQPWQYSGKDNHVRTALTGQTWKLSLKDSYVRAALMEDIIVLGQEITAMTRLRGRKPGRDSRSRIAVTKLRTRWQASESTKLRTRWQVSKSTKTSRKPMHHKGPSVSPNWKYCLKRQWMPTLKVCTL